MNLFRFLSRAKGRPTPSPVVPPSERAPVGIDYLRASAGLAEPLNVTPVNPDPKQEPIPDPPPGPVMTLSVSWDTLLEKAEKAQECADWDQAEVLWRLIRVGFPHVWFSYTGGAAALFNLGRHDEAGELLADAAVRFPEERAVPLEQGRQAMHRADWNAAETYWRSALTFDVRPWWVYTELAGALEQQGRLIDAEAVLLEGQVNAEDPNEITLFTYPARLAWKREDWTLAAARWVEARRRFPDAEGLPGRQYEALMRLAEFDPAAYEVALRDLGLASPGEDMRAAMLRFESLGGTGPDGGCEFGCLQRQHGAEPLGLFRWAAVSPTSLIACLNARFAGLGDPQAITIAPHDAQWEITDTIYGTKMHSFISPEEVPHDRMLTLASKRMGYLSEKLIADLQAPRKIFVLKVAWHALTAPEVDALSQAIRSYGPGELLCVCQTDTEHPEGTITAVAPSVFIGYLDFFAAPFDVVQRRPAWERLCRTMLGMSSMPTTD